MTSCLILLYISTKYHQNIPKGIWVTEQTRNLFQTKQREITPKIRKPALSFFYTTSPLVLFYISNKYHQNMPKGIQVTEQTRSFIQMPTESVPKTVCFPPFGRGDIISSYKHYIPVDRKLCLLKVKIFKMACPCSWFIHILTFSLNLLQLSTIYNKYGLTNKPLKIEKKNKKTYGIIHSSR